MNNIKNKELQEVPKTSIIELRQEDTFSDPLGADTLAGRWETTLKTPLTVRNNDVLSLKSVFIDSVDANSGKIKVEEDETTITTTQYLYINANSQRGKIYDGVSAVQPTGDINDTNKYILSQFHAPTGGLDITEVNSITFTYGGKTKGFPNTYQGETTIHLRYKSPQNDPNGNPIYHPLSVYIPRQDVDPIARNPQKFTFIANANTIPNSFPFQILRGSVVELDPSDKNQEKSMHKNGVRNGFVVNSSDINVKSIAKPYPLTTTFKIEAGEYLPDELAKHITDKASKLDLNLTEDGYLVPTKPTQNNFLITLYQIYDLFGLNFADPANPTADEIDARDHVMFVSEHGNHIIQFPTTINYPNNGNNPYGSSNVGNYFVGAAQVDFGFDTDTQKFTVGQSHTNLLGDGDQVIVQLCESNVGTGSGKYRWAGSAGGAILINLEPFTLWEKMGFLDDTTPNTLFPQMSMTPSGTTLNIGAYTDIKLATFQLKDGITNTNNYVGLQVAMPAGVLYPHAGNLLASDNQIPSALSNGAQVGTTTLIPIFAKNSINQVKDNNGYFMIEINGIEQTLNGASDIMLGIQSIISRFYNTGQNTTAYNEGSVQYVHKGNTMTLNTLSVRILDPYKEIASGLGIKNSIYLEHTTTK